VGFGLYCEGTDGAFGIGEPTAMHYTEDGSGVVSEKSEVVIRMENEVSVGGFQFDVVDSADVFKVTKVTSSLPAAWSLGYNELVSGDARIVVYNMMGDSIVAGTVTTITLEVEVDSTAEHGVYPITLPNIKAVDPYANTLWAQGIGGIFEVFSPVPTAFSLLSPVDGTVWTYNYDFLDPALTEKFMWEKLIDYAGEVVTYGIIFGVESLGEITTPIASDNSGLDTALTISVKDVLDIFKDLGVTFPANNVQGYWYVIATDGTFEVASIDTFSLIANVTVSIDMTESTIPDEYELMQNYPNPFNPTTSIAYGLPEDSNVRIDVYNLLGQTVVTLVNTRKDAGYHSVQWDGRDVNGDLVRSGVYIYKITANSFAQTKKMILLK
jgi:hypothetical protein